MNWLINRKKYKPFIYIITIVVYAANMALLMYVSGLHIAL